MKGFSFRPEPVRPDHPALLAWNSLRGACPASIDVLSSADGKPWGKSAIHKLNGVGIGGTAVVAKRSRRSTMLIERTVYEDILPILRLPALHYYGFVDHDDGLPWLFIQAAEGTRYSAESDTHRRYAAQWVGSLHTASAREQLASVLPQYEVEDHLRDVNFTRENILKSRINPVLTDYHATVLETTLAHCAWIELHREDLTHFCARMPRCLVHGDFDNKNVRIRSEEGTCVPEVMDWETASWSFPAVDVATIDLSEYARTVHPHWPDLTPDLIRSLSAVGRLFMNLGFIAAITPELHEEWAHHTVQDIDLFQQVLAEARRTLAWG